MTNADDFDQWLQLMCRASVRPCLRHPAWELPRYRPECPCPACTLGVAWDNIDSKQSRVLYEGMREQGFTWPKETE